MNSAPTPTPPESRHRTPLVMNLPIDTVWDWHALSQQWHGSRGQGKDVCKGNQQLMIDPLGALFRGWAGRMVLVPSVA